MNENRAFDLLGLIAHRLPDHDIAQSAFERAKAKNPGRTWADTATTRLHPRLIPVHEERPEPLDMHASLDGDLMGTLVALRSRFEESPLSREGFWSQISSLGHSVAEYPQDGIRLLEALCDSLDTESAAADRAITDAVLDAWLKSAAVVGEWEPIAELLARVAEIGGEHWRNDANFYEHSGVDWLTRAINDWTGKSAQLWMRLPQLTPTDDETQRGDALAAMQHGLTCLLGLPEAPSRYSAAMIGNRVNWLFAATPEWTIDTVLPLFDATTATEHAICAWNGYLYSTSASQQLLNAGLLEHYLTLLPVLASPRDPLSELRDGRFDYRREVNRHLAEISLFRGINPLQHGWLAKFVSNTPIEWRTAWAQALSSGLADMTVNARSAQWDSWIRDYLNLRTSGRPLALDPAEASEVAEWGRHFDREFPAFVALVLTWSGVRLRKGSRLVHSISNPKAGPDDSADTAVDVAAIHPDETAKLLAHLLSAVDKEHLRHHGSDDLVKQAAGRLRSLASKSAWRILELELMQLGLSPA